MPDIAALLEALRDAPDGQECLDLAGVIADALEDERNPAAATVRALRMEPAPPSWNRIPSVVISEANLPRTLMRPPIFVRRPTVGYAGPSFAYSCPCQHGMRYMVLREYTTRRGVEPGQPGMVWTDRFYLGSCPCCSTVYWSMEGWPKREHDREGWIEYRRAVYGTAVVALEVSRRLSDLS